MAVRVVPVVILAFVAISVRWYIIPSLDFLGITRAVSQLNEKGCTPIYGLEACEDQWIHRPSGISYLACSSTEARRHWLPAVDHLNGTAGLAQPSDAFFRLDTRTGKVDKVDVRWTRSEGGAPVHLGRFDLHGIDVFVDPQDASKFTVFAINHAIPSEPARAHETGADSTVEIFETRLESTTWEHVKTVRHGLVKTPNNLVATGPRQFYVTNDHVERVSWKRPLSLLGLSAGRSDIVYCDVSTMSTLSPCITAAAGFLYPNGITKGPDATIYLASSAEGTVTALERQADNTLTLGETVADLRRPLDNIHVTEAGEIVVAAIPKLLQFSKRVASGQGNAAAEVWKVGNETSNAQFYGQKYKETLIFADGEGAVVPALTNAQLYKGKLYLTGVASPYLVVCEHPSFAV